MCSVRVYKSGCVHKWDHVLSVWCVLVCAWTYVCVGACEGWCTSAHAYCTYASTANRFSSKQASCLRPQRKSTVRVFQSRPETMAPFIEGRWRHGGWGGSAKERRRERENRPLHIGLSLFPFFIVFATTLVDLSRKQGWALWPPADLQMPVHHLRHWLTRKEIRRRTCDTENYINLNKLKSVNIWAS